MNTKGCSIRETLVPTHTEESADSNEPLGVTVCAGDLVPAGSSALRIRYGVRIRNYQNKTQRHFYAREVMNKPPLLSFYGACHVCEPLPPETAPCTHPRETAWISQADTAKQARLIFENIIPEI